MGKEKTGILATIMGVTNIGKTTQQEMLTTELQSRDLKVAFVKFPAYGLLPTGPRINDYLRNKNPEGLTPLEFQKLNALNRKDFAPLLEDLVSSNDIVLAEMYFGTGIAYGMGDGISKDELINLDQELRQPDVSILLDGNRFLESREENHHFEKDDEKTERIRKIHLELAKDFNWVIVNANRDKMIIHNEILNIVVSSLEKSKKAQLI